MMHAIKCKSIMIHPNNKLTTFQNEDSNLYQVGKSILKQFDNRFKHNVFRYYFDSREGEINLNLENIFSLKYEMIAELMRFMRRKAYTKLH